MAVKPSIPKGTRDFSPEQVAKRNYIFNTIRSVFEKYGYQPIETPTMEMLSTLEGKYGNEGDRLLFRILDSGDYIINSKIIQWAVERLKDGVEIMLPQIGSKNKKVEIRDIDAGNFKIAFDNLSNINSKELTKDISEKGLRYDLTVPFARYVVMHQNEITFPFKRYQIQPVFRADRPQRGRYREFYQCDADVVGSNSLLNEVELIQIYDEVFTKLGIPVTIKINNRKILSGIAESLNIKGRETEFTTAIDKYDKIGFEGVSKELNQKRIIIDETKLRLLFAEGIDQNHTYRFATINTLILNSAIGKEGLDELTQLFNYLQIVHPNSKIEYDPALARGLNYYTGAIIEVKANNVQMGSIGGGGRYDDLTGVFGLPNVSGVGISFGADRIYDVLEELKLFPEAISTSSKVLFVNFDDRSVQYILPLLQQVRANGIAAELYPSDDKMKKQLGYADAKKIPFVVLAGEDEMNEGKLTLKNMTSSEQQKLTIDEVIEQVKSQL